MKTDIGLFLRKVKKLAPRTRALYGQHLVALADWCRAQGIDSFDQLTPDQVDAYLESRSTWGDSTRWSGVCALRRFVRWKYGEDHPLLAVKTERKISPPQRTLNRVKADQLLGLFDTSSPKGIRDLAIVTLALDTGLRANELVSVQLEYLDLDQMALFVPVKGGSWAPACFYEYTASCLARWLGVRETIAVAGEPTLFVSIGGTRPGTAITRDGLRAIFRRFSLHSVVGLISPHDLRRTFATLAVENGAPTRAVQVAGRWSHIKMVEHYTRALQARVLHRYSPVNKLMGVKPVEK